MSRAIHRAIGLVSMVLLFALPAGAMEKTELVRALRAMASKEADLVEKHPVDLVEEPLEFLAPYVSVRVTVRLKHHPFVFVAAWRAGSNAYVISRGAREYELFREAAGLRVQSEPAALAAGKWYLAATEGKSYRRVETLADIPFLPEVAGDEKRAADLKYARERLAEKIFTPTVTCVGDDYQVRLCAIQGRNLMAYTITVTATARITFQTESLVTDLPIVWVA